MRPSRGSLAAGLVAIGLLMTGAIGLARARDAAFPPPPYVEDSVDVTSGKAVHRMAAGFDTLAADLYWIRAIQYYGSERLRYERLKTSASPEPPPPQFQTLYPLLDLTTTLDPRFNIAYRFGSIFLAEPPPNGPGRPDLAVALLEKGLAARPDKWEYMQDIGFVHYWWRHDYKAAAEWFDKGSRVPGAPWWLRSLAATTLAEGGDRQSSRVMWESIRQTAEIDWLRQNAEFRLNQLRAMTEIEQLQAVVDRQSRAAGAPLEDWAPLIRGGILRRVPTDPADTPYLLEEGRVRLSGSSPLWPLADEPRRTSPPPS